MTDQAFHRQRWHVSPATIRAWPHAIRIGRIASELGCAATWLERGAMPEAEAALARDRELLSVVESTGGLPPAWCGPMAETMRMLVSSRSSVLGAAEARRQGEQLSSLGRTELEADGTAAVTRGG
jgi:hypothetical protein